MTGAPIGTVTFLFTDIEGSTRRWEGDPEGTGRALAEHDAILGDTIAARGGHVFKRVGDAFCAAFPTAASAVQAALEAQRRLLASGDGNLRVRMAIHAGAAERRDDDYFGPTLNRVARLVDAGHGGQVLLSGTARDLVVDALPAGADLRDRGEHRLKDLRRAIRVFQLVHPDLPEESRPLHSLDARRHNLPVQLTSFVGREREMAEIRARLSSARLLTLTGPGGSGKTRLATQLAAELTDDFPHGVWLVELAPLMDPGLVPHAVSTALGLREEPERDPVLSVAETLASGRTLLVLDNCEHVIDAAATLADRLLRGTTDLVILSTSREPLGIPGEVVWTVAPLSVPDPGESGGNGRVETFEAVRLFLDRARANRPNFELTRGNVGAVAEICRRLDGIPLAIELAAARIRALSAEQIAARLDDRFSLLTGGGRTALSRHQTLRAAVDWSHDLLSAPERVAFRRLAVFQGGWTLAAAEAVVAPDVLDPLARLVDKSMVTMEEPDAGPWYRFPETLREYARERLAHEEDDVEELRRRHRDFYLELAPRAERELETVERARWMARLGRERDNLRAAIEWSLEGDRDVERGLRLVIRLRMFWARSGSTHDIMAWLEQGLASPAELQSRTRIAALNALATSSAHINRTEVAERYASEALLSAREEGDRDGIMRALLVLASARLNQKDLARSSELYEEALSIARELGDVRAMTVALNNLGEVRRESGDLDRARAYYLRVLDEFPTVADREVLHFNLGQVALELEEIAEAGDHFRQCLEIGLETNPPYIALAILGIAQALVGTKRYERAALLFGASEALREESGLVIHHADVPLLENSLEAIRRALDGEVFQETWERGRAMGEAEAVRVALAEAGSPSMCRE